VAQQKKRRHNWNPFRQTTFFFHGDPLQHVLMTTFPIVLGFGYIDTIIKVVAAERDDETGAATAAASRYQTFDADAPSSRGRYWYDVGAVRAASIARKIGVN